MIFIDFYCIQSSLTVSKWYLIIEIWWIHVYFLSVVKFHGIKKINHLSDITPILLYFRCSWCNGSYHRKSTWWHKFKSKMRLFAFHIVLIFLGKVWIQVFWHNELSVRQWSRRSGFNPFFIPKTQKMVLDATLLNTQHYKVRIKGKMEQSREWSSALPYISV